MALYCVVVYAPKEECGKKGPHSVMGHCFQNGNQEAVMNHAQLMSDASLTLMEAGKCPARGDGQLAHDLRDWRMQRSVFALTRDCQF